MELPNGATTDVPGVTNSDDVAPEITQVQSRTRLLRVLWQMTLAARGQSQWLKGTAMTLSSLELVSSVSASTEDKTALRRLAAQDTRKGGLANTNR